MIQYFPTITGSLTVNGDLIVTGTGSMSASLALNSNLLQGTGSTGFATTASLTEVSSSQQQISASLLNVVANYATTGSNSFRADQSITGSLVVSSTITAQTLVVQTVTSSILYSSGSNLFGNALNNTQTFTGSVNITGSLTVTTTAREFQVNNTGVVIGNQSTDSHSITGSMGVSGSIVTVGGITSYSALQTFSNVSDITPAQLILSDTSNNRQLLIGYNSGSNYGSIQAIHQGVAYRNLILNASGGNVGIGTTNPTHNLEIANAAGSVYQKLSADFGVGYMGMETADDSMRFVTAQPTPIQFYTNNALRMTITNSGSIGIGCTPGTITSLDIQNASVTSNNVFLRLQNNAASEDCGIIISGSFGTGYEHRIGVNTIIASKDLCFTNSIGAGFRWYTDGTQALNLTSGGVLSVASGLFGSEKTVQINALNTSYLIVASASSGIVSARDNTNGGSGLWLLDPNGNGGTATLVAQNWINGVYTVFYSGGNTYVQKTSGNVPVIFHYAIYGN